MYAHASQIAAVRSSNAYSSQPAYGPYARPLTSITDSSGTATPTSQATAPSEAATLDTFAARPDAAPTTRLRPATGAPHGPGSSGLAVAHRSSSGESAARVAQLRDALARALEDARAPSFAELLREGGLKSLPAVLAGRRGKGTANLAHLAKRLAGPRVGSFTSDQVTSVLAPLLRPAPALSTASIKQEPQLANHPAMRKQYALQPLFGFCDALVKESAKLCNVLFVSASDEATARLLQRTSLALTHAIDVLESYEEYTLTPGHQDLHAYQAMLRRQDAVIQQRIRDLLAKERSQR